jgi:hypothetical protein
VTGATVTTLPHVQVKRAMSASAIRSLIAKRGPVATVLVESGAPLVSSVARVRFLCCN